MTKGFSVICNNCGEKIDFINQDGEIVIVILNNRNIHEIEIECKKCGNKDFNN